MKPNNFNNEYSKELKSKLIKESIVNLIITLVVYISLHFLNAFLIENKLVQGTEWWYLQGTLSVGFTVGIWVLEAAKRFIQLYTRYLDSTRR